jgi:hypothetical protein
LAFPLGLARMVAMKRWRVTNSERCAGASRRRKIYLLTMIVTFFADPLKSIVGRRFHPAILNLLLSTTALRDTAGYRSHDRKRSRLDIAAERMEGLTCARASES